MQTVEEGFVHLPGGHRKQNSEPVCACLPCAGLGQGLPGYTLQMGPTTGF